MRVCTCIYNEISVPMRVYTATLLPFLLHTSTAFSKSLLVNLLWDSMIIFIKLDRLSSVKQLQKRFFINFITEKLCSADVVETGIVKHMVTSLCR